MKKLVLLLLAGISLNAAAQTKTSSAKSETKQTITDDGKTLHININSTKNGKEIKYDRKFTVAGMSKLQKDALVSKIADSLGIALPPPPAVPHGMITTLASPETGISKDGTRKIVKDNGKTLHITLKSNHAGKQVNYDHTFAVAGMSKQQKDALVKHVTDSLGIVPPPAVPPHH